MQHEAPRSWNVRCCPSSQSRRRNIPKPGVIAGTPADSLTTAPRRRRHAQKLTRRVEVAVAVGRRRRLRASVRAPAARETCSSGHVCNAPRTSAAAGAITTCVAGAARKRLHTLVLIVPPGIRADSTGSERVHFTRVFRLQVASPLVTAASAVLG